MVIRESVSTCKNLNKVILREQYYPPSQQEIMSRLAGAKYFSNLDAKSGFWHMLLNTESSYLTWTFKIPFGRFLFLVVPFGVVFPRGIPQNNPRNV